MRKLKKNGVERMNESRRDFLKISAVTAVTLALSNKPFLLWALEPVANVENPLAYYPNRDWEKIYRDQYRYDRTFSWVCSPNDTHACRALAFVRNGIVIRLGAEYDYQN